VINAVRLMYAGAAYTAVWAVGVILAGAGIIRHHPIYTSTGDHRLAGLIFGIVFVAVIEIALWLVIAQACRQGRKWARITGTVLFGLDTLGLLSVVANSTAGFGPVKLLTVAGWLIGCAAVVYLWQRPSSTFFATRASRH
jgi:hypothetical protein